MNAAFVTTEVDTFTTSFDAFSTSTNNADAPDFELTQDASEYDDFHATVQTDVFAMNRRRSPRPFNPETDIPNSAFKLLSQDLRKAWIREDLDNRHAVVRSFQQPDDTFSTTPDNALVWKRHPPNA